MDGVRHDYDVVRGPIANDDIFYVIDNFMRGLWSAEKAVAEARAYKSCFQLSVHTDKAMAYVKYQGAEVLRKDGVWVARKN